MKKKIQKYIPILIGKQLMLRARWAPKKAAKQAFDLFCSPQKGRILPHESEFLEEAQFEKIITNAHKIQTYQWKGSGETILLLHGWESNSFRWKDLITALQKEDYNIISVDAPGQGNSSGKLLSVPLYTECVKDIIETYQPSALIGHSLGGMTAIYHQYKYNNPSIKQLIALGPPSELSLFMKGFQHTLRLTNDFTSKLDSYLHKKFGFYAHEFSIASFAKSLTTPGLLVLETNDKLAPYSYSKKIADNWNNSELLSVSNIGHSLQSNEINTKVVNFLNIRLK